jgi:hypothetical protein
LKICRFLPLFQAPAEKAVSKSATSGKAGGL